MKKMMISAIAIGCTLIGSAAVYAQSSTQDADKTFLTTAAQSDFNEIKFSELAEQKATNPRVKAFAQKMVHDHTQLEADVKPFADKWGVAPVTELDSEHQSKYDSLSSMSGADFDTQYMMDMDADHHKTLVLVLGGPGLHVGDRAQAVDAGVGPEVDQHHLALERIGGQRR